MVLIRRLRSSSSTNGLARLSQTVLPWYERTNKLLAVRKKAEHPARMSGLRSLRSHGAKPRNLISGDGASDGVCDHGHGRIVFRSFETRHVSPGCIRDGCDSRDSRDGYSRGRRCNDRCCRIGSFRNISGGFGSFDSCDGRDHYHDSQSFQRRSKTVRLPPWLSKRVSSLMQRSGVE